MQDDSKPFMVICLVGSWVASSDKALCLINTLTAALSGQSHSSSLLKWLRKSLWPLGDWYSNFPPASQMIRPEMRQTECDCLSLLPSFFLSPSLLFSLHFPCLVPQASLAHQYLSSPSIFISPPFTPLSLCASRKCNITCIFFPGLFFCRWSLKITLTAGNADFCFPHRFGVNKETFWLVKTGFW